MRQSSSSERVYEAVRELRAQGQTATRETVAALSGLKMSIVDDRLSVLVDDGKLKRVLRGVYELIEVYPPARAMSKTITSNGWVIYEVGDEVFKLSPSEDRTLSNLTAGARDQMAAVVASDHSAMVASDLMDEVHRLKRVIQEFQKRAAPSEVANVQQ